MQYCDIHICIHHELSTHLYLFESYDISSCIPASIDLLEKVDKELKILCKTKKKVVMFDIGANIGVFSFLAKKYRNLKVYAFEPVKQTYNYLQYHIKLNNLEKQIIPINCALTDILDNKTMDIRIPSDVQHYGLVTLGETPLRFDNYITETVKLDTLDNFCLENNIECIDIMKLDTEGWEYYILKGGSQIINKCHPIIISEYESDNAKQCNKTLNDLYNILKEELNYQNIEIFGSDIICK